MERMSVGRIVHVVMAGKHLPAIVTGVPSVAMDDELAMNNITVCVFPEGNVVKDPTVVRGVIFDDKGLAWGSWHWPEREV